MKNYLEGQAVVITGAGRGLGRSYAIAAAAAGAGVVVNDIDSGPAEEVVHEIESSGGRAVAAVGSVGDWSSAKDIVATCTETFGHISGLVNNAALMHTGLPHEATEEEIRSLVEVNLLGVAFVGTHAIRAMQGAGGRIVNITSTAHLGRAFTTLYGMTKGGVSSLTYAWAIELEEKGIKVNAVAPGASTRLTEMFPMTGVSADALPTPDEAAPLVTYLLGEKVPFVGKTLRLEKQGLRVIDPPTLRDEVLAGANWDPSTVASAVEGFFGV